MKEVVLAETPEEAAGLTDDELEAVVGGLDSQTGSISLPVIGTLAP